MWLTDNMFTRITEILFNWLTEKSSWYNHSQKCHFLFNPGELFSFTSFLSYVRSLSYILCLRYPYHPLEIVCKINSTPSSTTMSHSNTLFDVRPPRHINFHVYEHICKVIHPRSCMWESVDTDWDLTFKIGRDYIKVCKSAYYKGTDISSILLCVIMRPSSWIIHLIITDSGNKVCVICYTWCEYEIWDESSSWDYYLVSLHGCCEFYS